MTMDDLERPLGTQLKFNCTKQVPFEAYNENLNEDRPTLSAAKMLPDGSFLII